MSETSRKMLALLCVMLSLFLIMGGLYLPVELLGPVATSALTWVGVALLLGGNVALALEERD